MAAPSYTEDLTDVDLAESTTGWSAYGGGASGLSASPDLSMQGTNCVDKQITNADKGQYFDNGSGITLAAGDHVWIWHYCATPGLTDTIQNKGASVLVGTASNAYCQYHVEGNDTYGASGRVARCYPVDYSVRSTSASPPYRTATGSPGAAPQVFGGGLVTTASVKGANVGIDAIRYGTGAYLTAGELISAGDGSDNPCTFGGFSAQNDAVSNRWGILNSIGGSYELQGRFVIGQNNAGTPTLCRFEDSDVNIALVDTDHAATGFTQIIVDHASTVCNWTNVILAALGSRNPGRFVVNAANPEVNVTGGTWTAIGATTLRSNCTMTSMTWRRCSTITANGASFTDCVFDSWQHNGTTAPPFPSAQLVISDLDLLDNCTFIKPSGSTVHAINLGTISASDTMNWNNTDSGYASTNGSTGNETILVNVANFQTLTINVAAGATTPSVYNTGAGTVNVVSGQVTTTITVVDIDTGSAIQNANVYLVADAGGGLTEGTVIIGTSTLTDVNGQVSDTRSLGSNQPVVGRVRRASAGFGTLYKTANIVGTINSASGLDLTIQMQKDE